MVQFIAAAVAFLPKMRGDSATAAFSPGQTVKGQAMEPARTSEPAPAPSASQDTARILQAQQFIDQAYTYRNKGNYSAALQSLAEADKVRPNEPVTYFETAQTLELSGQLRGAIDVLRRSQALVAKSKDPNYAQLKSEIDARLAKLTGTAAAAGAADDAPRTPAAAATSGPVDALGLRDDHGIPVGSIFGIVECRISDDEAGYKTLRVATKCNGKEKIDRDAMQVAVDFYEKNEAGEVVKTNANLPSEWLSPNVDWADGEPELLAVKYPLPEQRGEATAVRYHGYVVGIYYKGELQDSRAEPVTLLDQFPLKLYLTEQSR